MTYEYHHSSRSNRGLISGEVSAFYQQELSQRLGKPLPLRMIAPS